MFLQWKGKGNKISIRNCKDSVRKAKAKNELSFVTKTTTQKACEGLHQKQKQKLQRFPDEKPNVLTAVFIFVFLQK